MQKRRVGLVILKAGQQLLKHLLGSTTMICEGKRLNSEISNWAGDKTENRAVKSTMGFFTKR